MIAIRGAGYQNEWGGNFKVYNPEGGDHLNHFGFDTAANQVLAGLKRYMSDYSESFDGTVKLWVVGYSRAGAVSNLVCSKVIRGAVALPVSIENTDVFGFGFESPCSTTDGDAHNSKFDGIKTYVNESDFVPMVPMNNGVGWTFGNYGVTYAFPTDDQTAYNKMKTEYESILATYTPQVLLKAALWVRLHQYDGSSQYATQEDFLKSFVNTLAKETQGPQQYCESGVQDLLVPLMTAVMGKKTLQWEEDEEMLLEQLASMTEDQLIAIQNEATLLLTETSQAQWTEIEQEVAKLPETIDKDYLLSLCRKANLGELVRGFPIIFQAHQPELCLSWVLACPNLSAYTVIVP